MVLVVNPILLGIIYLIGTYRHIVIPISLVYGLLVSWDVGQCRSPGYVLALYIVTHSLRKNIVILLKPNYQQINCQKELNVDTFLIYFLTIIIVRSWEWIRKREIWRATTMKQHSHGFWKRNILCGLFVYSKYDAVKQGHIYQLSNKLKSQHTRNSHGTHSFDSSKLFYAYGLLVCLIRG